MNMEIGRTPKEVPPQRGVRRMEEKWEDILPGDVFEMTDVETGEEFRYRVLAVEMRGGKRYAAILPDGEETVEYSVFEVQGTGADLSFVRIEDDDEWEDVASYFDNEIFRDVDHDE